MRCARCGADLAPGASRCVDCGASGVPTVASGLLTPPPPPLAADDAPTSLPSSESSGIKTDSYTSLPPSNPADSDTRFPGAVRGQAGNGPLEAGQTFGTRYHIIRALGIGGMGAVYQAWDADLGVAVAIKVIRPEVMADPAAAADVERRFKRELLLARQVTHKNVVRIHDLGEIDGIKYITMSYVDGEDLATLLKREGMLPVPTVMRIARSVVSGLREAHQAGVVHRDLKPANIMIERSGDALIMDFGIARSAGGPVSAAATATANALPARLRHTARSTDVTVYGAVVGTVEYMAPEQARGAEVDQRADIYALGLILYDMLVGLRRTEGGSAVGELRARMEQAPPAPRTLVDTIPEALDHLVARCLEPDPVKRYQTTADLAADLERLDENGIPIPVPRRFTPRLIAASAAAVVALMAGTWWLTRTPPPPKQHDPVSVLIADFQNQTGDATFDRSLESVMKLALEGAGFISAYDRTGVRALSGVTPQQFDDGVAQQLAVKQGVGIVLSGSLRREGSGYGISVKATRAVTGAEITNTSARAASKEQVVPTATKLATTIRKALGDETSNSAQLFAMDTLSTTSLDVVHQYAMATEAWSNGKYEDALQQFSKSVQLDPNFGMGYAGLAQVSRNLDKPQDAENYIKEALRHVDRMTERERYRARGFFYRVTGDYQACVKEYGDLITRYAADVAAHNQLALCSTFLRNMPKAVDEMRQAVKIVPQSAILRGNLALYEAYSGNFQAAEEVASATPEQRWFGVLAVAFGQLGQGKIPDALATYQKLSTVGAQGASYAATGLGDLAIYEGRFSEAVRILDEGATADLAAKNPDRAAVKYAALAFAQLSRGQKRPAAAAAEKALTNSETVNVKFLAARSLVEADQIASARAIAASLASQIQAAPQTHAKIIEGLIALKQGDKAQAIKLLTDANALLDTWIGHFDLGRANLEASQFIQADSEFDRCIKRRGEALSLFLDEHPTYGFLPSVYYYQGRVREGLNSAGFADSYREYLNIRGKSTEDPLLPEVRRRAGR